MRYIKTYEQFQIEDDVDVLEPEVKDLEPKNILMDRPIDKSLLVSREKVDDKNSYIDKNNIIHIKNWKKY